MNAQLESYIAKAKTTHGRASEELGRLKAAQEKKLDMMAEQVSWMTKVLSRRFTGMPEKVGRE